MGCCARKYLIIGVTVAAFSLSLAPFNEIAVAQTPINIDVIETISLSDTPTATPPASIDIIESITVTDSPVVLPPVSINVAESLVVTDTPELTPLALQADFSADKTLGVAPLEVQFTDNSSGGVPPLTFQWDFDNDGTVDSTEQNPTFVYDVGGNCTVTCTVVDSVSDTDTEIKTDYITVTENTPPGSDVCVSFDGGGVCFSAVTSPGGTTTMTTSQGNPGGPLPPNFRMRGEFVEITTTATYTGSVTVGIRYDPGTPNPQNLKLFHDDEGRWVDVTTWVDTANRIVYGEVPHLSWFFIGEQWVWVEGVPAFPSLYVGIAAAFGAAILAYMLRRRLIEELM